MIKIPKTEELFDAAVHVGHTVGKLHPKMKPYVHSLKNGVHWLDLEKTRECLQKAVDFAKEVIAKNGKILFVGTKPAAQAIIKKYAEKVGMPYVSERWLGGTITNFSTISSLIKKLKKMEEDRDKGGWKKYTKREQLNMAREVEKLNLYVGGMRSLEKLPEALYIVDLNQEKTAVNEARRAKIKTIAICDVNTNPTFVTHPIPANDDAIKSIEIITNVVAEAMVSKK